MTDYQKKYMYNIFKKKIYVNGRRRGYKYRPKFQLGHLLILDKLVKCDR